jgi:DNA ligase-1
MHIQLFAEYLTRLDQTTKRLEITDILAYLIQEVEQDEVENAINLTLGQLYAPFKDLTFNVADKMMIRALEDFDTTNSDIAATYRKLGDLGDTASTLSYKKTSNLTINQVHKLLAEIALLEGSGSQEKKIVKLVELFKELDNTSLKYVVRIVLGTTRLGFTATTIVDALSYVLGGNKDHSDSIEKVYNIHPDIALIAKQIKIGGLQGLETIHIETGVPILSEKPQRVASPDEVIEKMASKEIWIEYKLDGTRVQIHFDKNKSAGSDTESLFEDDIHYFVGSYTRNLDDSTNQFPDVIEGVKKQIKATSVILDGEAIGYDKATGKFLDFQTTIKRKRKHGVSDSLTQIPLKYFVFDILYLDGKSLIDLPLRERKQILKDILLEGDVVEFSPYVETHESKVVRTAFEEAKTKGLEGLVIKNPDKGYEAGARSFTWVKLKRIDEEGYSQGAADSVDCVVMGYYTGKGIRTQFGMGAFLAGVYDEEALTFKSVTKVGTGMKEVDLQEIKKMCDKYISKDKPSEYSVDKDLYPDVWVKPRIVVELRADEITISPKHTASFALRFPRLIRIRMDKTAEQATNIKELKDLFLLQRK